MPESLQRHFHSVSAIPMSDPIDDQSISTFLQNYHRESDALITDRLTPETEEPGTREYDFVTVHELNALFQASHVQDSSEDEDNLYGDLPPTHPSSGLSDFGTGELGYNLDDLDYSMDPPPSIQEEDDDLYGMDLPQIESDGSYTMDLGSGTGVLMKFLVQWARARPELMEFSGSIGKPKVN
jgi:hypothetical protein